MTKRRTLVRIAPAAMLLAPMFSTRIAEAGPPVARPINALLVAAAGVVGGPPENVAFTGHVRVRGRLVFDADLGTLPSLQLIIDLQQLVGRGQSTGARYGSAVEFLHTTFVHDRTPLELAFPFEREGRAGHLTARTGMLVLAAEFDARDGRILSASGRISSNA